MAGITLDPQQAEWTRADLGLKEWHRDEHWFQGEKQSSWRGERPNKFLFPKRVPMLFMHGNWYVQTM